MCYALPMKKSERKKIANHLGVTVDRIYVLEHRDSYIVTHRPDQCAGEVCCVHNKTNHSMRGFPQVFRYDRGIMERICTHGVGHPDPDQDAFFKKTYGDDAWAEWIHGCCGCCI